MTTKNTPVLPIFETPFYPNGERDISLGEVYLKWLLDPADSLYASPMYQIRSLLEYLEGNVRISEDDQLLLLEKYVTSLKAKKERYLV